MSERPPDQLKVVSGLGESPRAGAAPQVPLDQRTFARALDCVHCGLCLPACPTYTQNGLEADSPRGRIMLMKGLATGRIAPTEPVVKHLDLCLDCRACETACPSGVVYHELIEETRTHLAAQRPRTRTDRLLDALIQSVFPYPNRLKLALLPARVLQKVGLWHAAVRLAQRALPSPVAKLTALLPPQGPLWEGTLAERYPAPTEPRLRVGLLAGCVGSVLFQDVNRQAIALLRKFGCEVHVPRTQTCCGAIGHHAGHTAHAVAMAKQNIAAFEAADVDRIVTDVAGCGAMLREYDQLLRDDAEFAGRARALVAKVRDIHEVLVELKPGSARRAVNVIATYHDACHLAHAQKVVDAPRQLLAKVPGLTLIPLAESDMCCGAAGTYNLTQPAMAADLGARKIANIRATGATVCLTANAGCALQIQSEAARVGLKVRVLHPVTLLHEAYV